MHAVQKKVMPTKQHAERNQAITTGKLPATAKHKS